MSKHLKCPKYHLKILWSDDAGIVFYILLNRKLTEERKHDDLT